jgi:hypothetical protein
MATPLNWVFTGTTAADADTEFGIVPSNFKGVPITAGTPFTLTIFVDTSIMRSPGGFSDITFDGPFQGQVQIGSLGTLLLEQFANVEHSDDNGQLAGVEFTQQGHKTFTNFSPKLAIDPLHLTPFGPVSLNGLQELGSLLGPDLAFGVAGYATFVAITPSSGVPDAGSTAYLFALGLLLLLTLKRYSLRER